jgi:hypothetical protein
MARWSEFAAAKPALAEAGRALLYQYGPGLGYLATVRPDGGPRLHPVCPFISGEDLVVFIVEGSPKCRDLMRDGRVAIHTYAAENVDDEFYLTGVAHLVTSPTERAAAIEAYHVDQVPDDHSLFRIDLRSALHAKYRFRGDWPPEYQKWREA